MTLLLAKIGITVAFVFILTWIAERVHPTIAGILSGFPLGIALTLYFFGFEQGPEFASNSAQATVAAFSANIASFYFYGLAIIKKDANPFLASVAGISAFFIIALVLSVTPADQHILLGLAISVASIAAFQFLQRDFKGEVIANRAPLTIPTIFIRSGSAAATVVLITWLAHSIGVKWSGLLAGFAITAFPFLVLIHVTYGKGVAISIIQKYPLGIGSLIVYCLGIAQFYPAQGINLGTVYSLLYSIAYLLLLAVYLNWQKKKLINK